MRTMFWEVHWAFKKNSAELTRVGAVFSSLLELGILPGEGALRKATTRFCVFIVIFGCQGFLYLLLSSWLLCWLVKITCGLSSIWTLLCCWLGCAAFPHWQNEPRWTANALCCLDAVGPDPKSTGNTDSSLKWPQGQVQSLLCLCPLL